MKKEFSTCLTKLDEFGFRFGFLSISFSKEIVLYNGGYFSYNGRRMFVTDY